MTKDNYTNYLIGTVAEYPDKVKRHLKKLFISAGVASFDDQIRLPMEDEISVYLEGKDLTEQIISCLSLNESAQRIFEKW